VPYFWALQDFVQTDHICQISTEFINQYWLRNGTASCIFFDLYLWGLWFFCVSLRTTLLSLSRMNLYVRISFKCLCGGTIIWSLIFCVRITRCRFPTDVLCFHNKKNSNMWTNVHLGHLSSVSDYSLISSRTCNTNIHLVPSTSYAHRPRLERRFSRTATHPA